MSAFLLISFFLFGRADRPPCKFENQTNEVRTSQPLPNAALDILMPPTERQENRMKSRLTIFCLLPISLTSKADCGGICSPGPGTPAYAVAACNMVNSYPQNIRANTCVNANGCVMQTQCM
jgi:hypothetical protein